MEKYQKGKIPYTAFFVVSPEKLASLFIPKHIHVFGHHMTIEFNPKDFSSVQVGKRGFLNIIARIFDEKGDALLVDTPRSEKAHPHITLSCAEGVRRSYSDELIQKSFKDGTVNFLPTPVPIEVVEGYFDGEKDVVE